MLNKMKNWIKNEASNAWFYTKRFVLRDWCGLKGLWGLGKDILALVRENFMEINNLRKETGYGRAFWNRVFRFFGNWGLILAAFLPSLLCVALVQVGCVILSPLELSPSWTLGSVFTMVNIERYMSPSVGLAVTFADRVCPQSPPEGNSNQTQS